MQVHIFYKASACPGLISTQLSGLLLPYIQSWVILSFEIILQWQIFLAVSCYCTNPYAVRDYWETLDHIAHAWQPTLIYEIQVNLDMTDHCTMDFRIWRTICLVPVRCISSIRHMYTTDFAYDGPIFLVPLSPSYPSSPVLGNYLSN